MNSETISVSTTSRYVTFQDDHDSELSEPEDDFEIRRKTAQQTLDSEAQLMGNGQTNFNPTYRGGGSGGDDEIFLVTEADTGWTNFLPKRIRLRAVESEQQYFLNLLNIILIRKLCIVQAVASGIIVISQIILYAGVSTQSYKFLDYVGIGLWAPILFFSIACLLTWIISRSPSGCIVGVAMAFQITSVVIGLLLIIFATIALVEHTFTSRYMSTSWNDTDKDSEEISGRIICSFIILSALCVTMVAFGASLMFCRATCCARANAHENVLFDVENIKP